MEYKSSYPRRKMSFLFKTLYKKAVQILHRILFVYSKNINYEFFFKTLLICFLFLPSMTFKLFQNDIFKCIMYCRVIMIVNYTIGQ